MKVLKYLLLLIAIFAAYLMPVTKCDEGEAVVVVEEEEMVNLGKKTIIDAPVFCPSNYRLDHRGKCRRMVF